MPLATLGALDHLVIAVRELDEAATQWQRLGFTLSPRGTHSAYIGTANHTIMFAGGDYLELLGVLTPTVRNAPTRDLLAKREGLERIAFKTSDAKAGVAAVTAQGINDVIGPLAFSRPVARADGTTTEASFEVFHWPQDHSPGGIGLFACQHLTPDAVWLPELVAHANGATRMRHVAIVTARPSEAAEHLVRLTGYASAELPDSAFEVQPSGGGGAFQFLTGSALSARYPAIPLVPDASPALLTEISLFCSAPAKVAATLGKIAICTSQTTWVVPPERANGVLLEFVAQ